ncbi:N-acetyltransferase [Paracoccus denitrificans]|jgi:GNAT superfamily N-acetyltransferase|uniref:Putative acetyltransferase protein n=1 Tax=Paracoccus denitrificans (strain Pd 1222) TaxID=318586 RepID=A1BBX0_PARDP|nr:N-acetyltransferase [Paracoccus denitrificans]ABL73014.1 putative acetyltransferase protein [Paracoccus denitrificans PD1222]MBB4628390.1 GNAT superfamily N-acetyltransferase [Paracoccus denitrificans]MCU7429602.1 N-acetyltransferase [Paracoccus denitrificans]QAR29407.1 N-acetyltransferase [Paracoccus denitrificans]UPV98264.1 N-acetyltransferase [Paracoccus denitrificans]
MQANPTKTVETFALVAQPMTRADIPRLHELSVGVGWMHRPEDWEAVLGLGKGLFVVDEIGRAVASAMWFPMGDELASIGMVITAPRLQEYGTGRWLMEQILGQTTGRDLMLSATHAAYKLYCSLGLQPGPTIFQHNGFVTDAPPGTAPPEAEVRPLHPEDEAAIRALDARAFTAQRQAVLDHLLSVGQGTVLLRQGHIAGFAFCRRFGRGHVIGPVVADTEAEAIALISPHIRAHAGGFVRMDTRQAEGPLRDHLTACGMKLHETATSMSRGAERFQQQTPRIFGLFSQALG